MPSKNCSNCTYEPEPEKAWPKFCEKAGREVSWWNCCKHFKSQGEVNAENIKHRLKKQL
jgi:hypothetical protein